MRGGRASRGSDSITAKPCSLYSSKSCISHCSPGRGGNRTYNHLPSWRRLFDTPLNTRQNGTWSGGVLAGTAVNALAPGDRFLLPAHSPEGKRRNRTAAVARETLG